MDLLHNHLQVLGLTQEEMQVYITSLEKRSYTVLEFAQNTGIPRTTVYLLVESLLMKGLLEEQIEGKRKKYIPISPLELVQLAKKKEAQFKETAKKLEASIGQIQALYSRDHDKPIISVKQGTGGAKELFNDALNSDTIYMHFTSAEGQHLLGDLGEEFYEKCLKKMIHTKQIIIKSPKNVTFKEVNESTRNEIVLLDAAYTAEIDYMIYNDVVVFISYKERGPYIVSLKDPQITYFEKLRFNILFSQLTNTFKA